MHTLPRLFQFGAEDGSLLEEDEGFAYAIVIPPKRLTGNLLKDLKSGTVLEKAHETAKLIGRPASQPNTEPLEPLGGLIEQALERSGLVAVSEQWEDYQVVLIKIRDASAAAAMATLARQPVRIDAKALAERARERGTYFHGDKDAGQTHARHRGALSRFLCGTCCKGDYQSVADDTEDKGARNPYNFLHAPYSKELESLLVRPALNDLAKVSLISRMVSKCILNDAAVRQHWDDADGDPTKTSRPWTGIGSLLIDGNLAAAYPLHIDARRLHLLNAVCHKEHLIWRRSYERFVERELYDYFGVAVAFYFCFLSHYARWLRFLILDGIIMDVGRRLTEFDAALYSVCGVFAVVWCFGMLRAWSDREARLALRWGMLGNTFELRVPPRSNFVGLPGALDPVTGSTSEPYFPLAARKRKQRVSHLIVCAGLMVALANVVICKSLRVELIRRSMPALPSTIVNAVVVFFLNNAALGVASRRAEAENHKFDADYEAAVFAYVLVFRVVNSFATLFYTAYLKKPLEGACRNGDCFADAGHCAFVFFLVQLTVGNTLELGPALFKYTTTLKEVATRSPLEMAVAQFALAESPAVDVLDDYLEITIQFGYCVLFFVCFPLAPILALLNNLLEAKIDALKRLSKRRPSPTDQTSIKVYTNACLSLAYLAVFNNVALVCLVMPDKGPKIIKFVQSSLALLAISFLVYRGANTLPYDVDLQLKRQEYVLSARSNLLLAAERAHLDA